MTRHSKTHTESLKKHECDTCKKVFLRNEHLRKHTEKCYKLTLQRHLEMNHKLKFPGNAEIISQEKVKAQNNFKCPYCAKKYTSNQSVQHFTN